MMSRGIRLLAGMSALLLLFTGCGKAPLPDDGLRGAIGFCPCESGTRAIIDGSDESNDNTIAKDAAACGRGFGVVGYRNKGDWSMTFPNVKVAPAATAGDPPLPAYPVSWEYSGLQYWEFCPYRFFAYYPHNASATMGVPTSSFAPTINTSNCLQDDESKVSFSVSYTVPNSWKMSYAADQVDFMLAAPKLVSAEDNNKEVEFNFSHALCQVGFRICKTSTSGSLEIVDLQLRRLTSKGTASHKAGESSISWGSRSLPVNYSYAGEAGGQSIPYCPAEPEEQKYLTVPNMLLQPQTLSTSNMVEITVKDTDQGDKTWTLLGQLSQPSIKEWKPGKRYIYTLTINTAPVLLDMSLEIADWTDVNINVTI